MRATSAFAEKPERLALIPLPSGSCFGTWQAQASTATSIVLFFIYLVASANIRSYTRLIEGRGSGAAIKSKSGWSTPLYSGFAELSRSGDLKFPSTVLEVGR
jgi:hypothetical protein